MGWIGGKSRLEKGQSRNSIADLPSQQAHIVVHVRLIRHDLQNGMINLLRLLKPARLVKFNCLPQGRIKGYSLRCICVHGKNEEVAQTAAGIDMRTFILCDYLKLITADKNILQYAISFDATAPDWLWLLIDGVFKIP